jgi:hypothetical protein
VKELWECSHLHHNQPQRKLQKVEHKEIEVVGRGVAQVSTGDSDRRTVVVAVMGSSEIGVEELGLDQTALSEHSADANDGKTGVLWEPTTEILPCVVHITGHTKYESKSGVHRTIWFYEGDDDLDEIYLAARNLGGCALSCVVCGACYWKKPLGALFPIGSGVSGTPPQAATFFNLKVACWPKSKPD